MEYLESEYADVVPLEIESGLENELCRIMYTDEYKQVLGVARRLMQQKEYSQRALKLTSKVVDLVSSFYTVWNYRYKIVEHLLATEHSANHDKFLDTELDWLDEVTLNNPKNYQIWSYRQSILKLYKKPQFKRELPILQMMIDDDSKNYHVWSYRKWCVLFFKDFSQEMQFADSFIERDVYNNSAWTHRMFVLKHTSPSKETVIMEIEYVKNHISIVPQNVSTWNYMRGLHRLFLNNEYDASTVQFALSFTNNLLEMTNSTEQDQLPQIESSFAVELLAEYYSQQPSTHKKAKRAWNALSVKYDPIRSSLWNHKITRMAQQASC